jgi:hypothetical protein
VIKLIFIGIWVCAITLASSYAAVSWRMNKTKETTEHGSKLSGALEHVKTKMISVPIIADGAIQGYVVAQFSFTIDASVLKRLTIKPDVFLLDEAFKTIYAGEAIDFRKLKKQDLSGLLKTLGDNVNKRFGAPFVESVLIQELNYVPKAEARQGER